MIAYILFTLVLLSISVNGQCPAGQFYDGRWCCACNSLPNCRQVTCVDRTKSTCAQCASGYIRSAAGTCIKSCASNQFWDATYNQCCECGTIANCVDRTCVSKTQVTCKACKTGYTLVNNKCVLRPTCVAPQFYDAQYNQCCDCNPIPYCADRSCSSKDVVTCHSCQSGYVLLNNRCVVKPTCRAGTYYSPATNTCPSCSPIPNCSTRTCTSSSSATCTACNSGYRLLNGVCSQIPTCAAGTYLTSSNTCANCLAIANCAARTCTNGASSVCSKCQSGYVLRNNQCIVVPTCTGATIYDAATNQCVACTAIANCLTLSCTSKTASTCSKCKSGYILKNNQCVAIPTCTAGTYYVASSNTCVSCTAIANCAWGSLTCTSTTSSTCTKCKTGYILRNNQCIVVPTCTGATFYDSAVNQCCACTTIANCETLSCTSKAASTCSKCKSGYVLRDNQCVAIPTCTGATYYVASSNTCVSCTAIANCAALTCTSAVSTCSSCKSGYVLRDNQCVAIPTCTGATFYDSATNECLSCTAIANCRTLSCKSKAASTCSACKSGYVLRDNKCVAIPTCTGATFYDAALNECVACTSIANCAQVSCTSRTTSTCSACKVGHLLRNGQCVVVPTCTGATFYDAEINECCTCTAIANCATGALTCKSKTVSTCTACQDGFVLRNNACVLIPTCTRRQYLDATNNVCVDCQLPSGCLDGTCAASGFTCASCADSFVMINGVCKPVPTCTHTQYYTREDNLCKACNFPANCLDGTCKTATDAVCTLCDSGYTLIDGVCQQIPTCTSSQYYKPVTNQCLDCPLLPNCVSRFCSDEKTIHCANCASGYVNIANVGCVKIPTCTETQYLDVASNTCVNCAVPEGINCAAASCAAGSAPTCIRCVDEYSMVDGVCKPTVPTCQEGTYLDPETNLCRNCRRREGCLASKCTGFFDAECVKCAAGYLLSTEGQCIPFSGSGSGSGSVPAPVPVPSPVADTPVPSPPAGYDLNPLSFANENQQATETTTVSSKDGTSTTISTSDDNHGFAIAVGVFAGVVVALLVTLVVVLVTRNSHQVV